MSLITVPGGAAPLRCVSRSFLVRRPSSARSSGFRHRLQSRFYTDASDELSDVDEPWPEVEEKEEAADAPSELLSDDHVFSTALFLPLDTVLSDPSEAISATPPARSVNYAHALPRETDASDVFRQGVNHFQATFHLSVAKFLARARSSDEQRFLRPHKNALGLLVGRDSPWIKSETNRLDWTKRIRGAHDIADFGRLLDELQCAIDSDVFERDFHMMSSAYEGIAATVERYGY
jgi:hypothetical protein